MNYDKINLLPDEVKKRRTHSQRSLVVIAAMGAYVIGVLLAFIVLTFAVNSVDSDLAVVKQKRAILRTKISQYVLFEKREKELNARKNLLVMAKKDELQWSAVLYKLSLLLPPQVWLSNFKADEEKLVLSGNSLDLQGVSGSILQMLNLEELSDKVVLQDIVRDKETESLVFNLNTDIRELKTQAGSVPTPPAQGGK